MPSNGWQAKLSQKHFATMASRFEKVDDEFIEELKEIRKYKEEHRVLEKRFQKMATERDVNANLEEYECEALHQTL